MRPPILFFSLFCLMLVSCADDTIQPVEPATPDTTVVEFLTVRRLQDWSVEVSWPVADPTARSVMLTWEPAGYTGMRDSAQIALDATSTNLTGLDPTLQYALLLTIRKSGGSVYLLPGTLYPVPPPGRVDLLQASSRSATSVALQWRASATPGVTYLVSYRKSQASDTASSDAAGSGITVSGTTAMIEGLGTGAYTFHVVAVDRGVMSKSVAMIWAPATRFTHDAGNPSTPLRMYEPASANGSGLILDPVLDGPRLAALGTGSSASVGSVALAISTGGDVPPSSFEIGPAYAFPGYRDGNRWDSSVYVSDNRYPVTSLDDHYFGQTLEHFFTGGGNMSRFRLPATSTDGKSITFFIHLGNDGIGSGRHYARVLVKADDTGRLLRGTAPNRYVELEISYQTIAGLPSA